ncbi:MAG: DUF1735 domain-containing protein [Marinilabiliaceae bacterium]|nr:DUF1735 domain-containing protein [Marinilabiliaceae bacterium]
MKLYKILLIAFTVGFIYSCENEDATFPDFNYTTVYFANQYPMRILELGDDNEVDNSLDNEHKVKINATMGGIYSNTTDRIIDIEIVDSLCNGLSFAKGTPELVPMPTNYYNLTSNKIVIKAGTILGGVEVQLTDAFFNDSLTIGQHYVIPVLMKNVTNADSILSGKAAPFVENPNRFVTADWSVLPKDYMLYAIKYVNKYHANYLRRGVDIINDGTNTITDVRHQKYVEYDEVVSTSTLSLTKCLLPINIYKEDNSTTLASIELILTFNDDNNCTVTSNSSAYTINGTGKFVNDGEKNSIGGLDRNALYLDYTVELTDIGHTYSTKDTLVCRDRGIVPDYFSINVN